MSQSAQAIHDHAPLGARMSFSNGQSRPPERFKRKLREWKNYNGVGYLVERSAGYRPDSPAIFVLRTGEFGSRESTVLIVNIVFHVDSALEFAVVGEPSPGQILCLTGRAGKDELQQIASSRQEADAWLDRNRYSNARLETVPDRQAVAA